MSVARDHDNLIEAESSCCFGNLTDQVSFELQRLCIVHDRRRKDESEREASPSIGIVVVDLTLGLGRLTLAHHKLLLELDCLSSAITHLSTLDAGLRN